MALKYFFELYSGLKNNDYSRETILCGFSLQTEF